MPTWSWAKESCRKLGTADHLARRAHLRQDGALSLYAI